MGYFFTFAQTQKIHHEEVIYDRFRAFIHF